MFTRFQNWVRDSRPWARRLPLVVVLLVGAGLAWASHHYAAREGERALQTRVRAEAQDRAELLRVSARQSLEVLHAIASLFEVSGATTRHEFQRFVQGSLERLPQLQALEWIPRVPHSEREAWELQAREDGISGYGFTEIAPDGSVRAARVRPEYFPVYYAEPAFPNLPALGLDLASNPERRQALLGAAATRSPVSTQTIRLAQEKSPGRFGFLVFQPLYEEPRGRGPLSGFALAVFRVDDFFAPAFASMREDELSVRVMDPNDPSHTLLSAGAASQTAEDRFEHEETVEFAGRRWQLIFSPTPLLMASYQTPNVYTYPMALLLLTGLLCAYIYREQRRTREVAQANARLQAEVSIRKRAQQDAARAQGAQASFLASMSHEIRTPLNAIVGYSQLLHRQLVDPNQREAITVMLQSSNHLLALVDDILDLSQIESGNTRLDLVDFDLGALLSSVAFMFRPKCERRGLALKLHGIGVAPCWVRGDERKLRQVLMNLLSNAVKYTEQGEVQLSVQKASEQEFEFEVVDTGQGIAEQEQQHIFARFFHSETARQPGTGLGLAISKRLVEAMGGQFRFTSELGQGSSFGFTVHLGPSVAVVRSESNVRIPCMRLTQGSVCRAMVVDDLKVNRDILCAMLESLGVVTLSVASGARAVELGGGFAPHIVFMDVLMPGMDGFETTRALLERLGRDHVKIVAYSASALPEHRTRYREAGFDDFIPKPFRIERINEVLAALVGLEFEAVNAPPPSTEGLKVDLPVDIRKRLTEAARLYQSTRLRAVLTELESLGENQALLAERLRSHAVSYDMTGLMRELERACPPRQGCTS